MSEPNLKDWKFWATSPFMWTALLPSLAMLILVVGIGLGLRWGNLHGRAEQKKLDEAECAAHPVVKEVKLAPCESQIYRYRADMGIMECVPAEPKVQ